MSKGPRKSLCLVGLFVLVATGCQANHQSDDSSQKEVAQAKSNVELLTSKPEFTECVRLGQVAGEQMMCAMIWDPVCVVSNTGELYIDGNDCEACTNEDALGYLPIEYCKGAATR